MSPDDVKKWLDLLVVLIGSGGVGTIILAFIGYWKARAERPPPPNGNIGHPGMAQIAGMVMGQSQLDDIIGALRLLATAMSAQAIAVENHMRATRDTSDTRHGEARRLNDHLDTIGDRLKDVAERLGRA